MLRLFLSYRFCLTPDSDVLFLFFFLSHQLLSESLNIIRNSNGIKQNACNCVGRTKPVTFTLRILNFGYFIVVTSHNNSLFRWLRIVMAHGPLCFENIRSIFRICADNHSPLGSANIRVKINNHKLERPHLKSQEILIESRRIVVVFILLEFIKCR